LVIYGNAFIEKNSEPVELVRHDPATSIINTEVVTHGNFPEEVVYLITKVGKRITSDNLTHLAINIIEPPFGESPYGQWFNDWHMLKLSRDALINASIFKNQGYVGRRPEEIAKIKKEIEKRVILGSGLDPAIFDESLSSMPYNRELALIDARLIQGEIVSKVEEEIFPFT
jgi:hypothetical protein